MRYRQQVPLGLRLRRGALLALAAAMAGPLTSPHLEGQSIRGRVLDATRGSPVAAAEIEVAGLGGYEKVAVTDSSGAFAVRVPEAGWYTLRATSLGYEPSDSTMVEVERWSEQIEVLIRLATSPIQLEGITVVARGLELRHRATFGGFVERHRDALDVGSSRLFASEDPEMRTAFDVGDVLEWVNVAEKCTVIHVDGRVAPSWADFVDIVTVKTLAGVEYYRSFHDAPLELRDGGPPCMRALDWSVIALWRR